MHNQVFGTPASINCYLIDTMRTLSAIFTLAAVVTFTVVPYLTDWHAHYLGDRVEEVGGDLGQGNPGRSTHHKDCQWLVGTGGVQATLTLTAIVFGFNDFSPWVANTPRPCFTFSLSAFHSRAPPNILS